MPNYKNKAILGLTASLGIVAATSAIASTVHGDFIVPSTSIERTADRGVRAHTNFVFAARTAKVKNYAALPGTESPTSLRAVYNVPSTAKGGNAIAIIDAYDDPKALNDFNYYSNVGGYPVETSTNATLSTNKVFQVVYAAGTKPRTDPGGTLGWDLEESLDFESAHGIAPSAKIYLVEAASSSFNDLFTAINTAKKLAGVKEISMSFGGAEWSSETQFDSQLTAAGITFFASTGDHGAGVSFPAISTNVVAVGGTTIKRTATGAFLTETGWAGSGGGLSSFESKPAFQNNISLIKTKRANPDISADADPYSGIGVYDTNNPNGAWFQVGGTSLAAPVVAALVNDAASNRSGSQDENASIYKALLGANLRDVTQGANGYQSTLGYDFVTGVGSPNGLAAL